MIVGHRDNVALVFAVIPTTAFGGGYAQTKTRVSAS
jgi:hypothetical protein